MEHVWESVIVGKKPAHGFWKWIERFPANAEKMPEVLMDGQDFNSTGDVDFWQPGSMARQVDESDDVVDSIAWRNQEWEWDC